GIAEIERAFRLQQRPIAGAADDPLSVLLLDKCTHGLHVVAGTQHVLPFEEAGNAGFAGGKAPEHEGAMRNRFVARYTGTARKRRRTPRGRRFWLGVVRHRGISWICGRDWLQAGWSFLRGFPNTQGMLRHPLKSRRKPPYKGAAFGFDSAPKCGYGDPS